MNEEENTLQQWLHQAELEQQEYLEECQKELDKDPEYHEWLNLLQNSG